MLINYFRPHKNAYLFNAITFMALGYTCLSKTGHGPSDLLYQFPYQGQSQAAIE